MNMVEVNTSDLIGSALDWAVGMACGHDVSVCVSYSPNTGNRYVIRCPAVFLWEPSTNWSQCGPLIEKYQLRLVPCDTGYFSYNDDTPFVEVGKTALIAACRAIAACTHGVMLQVPAELIPKPEK